MRMSFSSIYFKPSHITNIYRHYTERGCKCVGVWNSNQTDSGKSEQVCSGATLVFRARQTIFRPYTWNGSLIMICVCVSPVASRAIILKSSQYCFNDWWHEVGHLTAGSDFLLPKCNLHDSRNSSAKNLRFQLPFGWIAVIFVYSKLPL
jgi:hypothetical protein